MKIARAREILQDRDHDYTEEEIKSILKILDILAIQYLEKFSNNRYNHLNELHLYQEELKD